MRQIRPPRFASIPSRFPNRQIGSLTPGHVYARPSGKRESTNHSTRSHFSAILRVIFGGSLTSKLDQPSGPLQLCLSEFTRPGVRAATPSAPFMATPAVPACPERSRRVRATPLKPNQGKSNPKPALIQGKSRCRFETHSRGIKPDQGKSRRQKTGAHSPACFGYNPRRPGLGTGRTGAIRHSDPAAGPAHR